MNQRVASRSQKPSQYLWLENRWHMSPCLGLIRLFRPTKLVNCPTYFDPSLCMLNYCVVPWPDAIYRAFTCQEPSISNIMEFTCPRGVSPDLDVKQKRSTESPRWFVYQERFQKHPFHLKNPDTPSTSFTLLGAFNLMFHPERWGRLLFWRPCFKWIASTT